MFLRINPIPLVERLAGFLQDNIILSDSQPMSEFWSGFISHSILILSLAVIAIITDWVGKNIFVSVMKRVTKKTKTHWDDLLLSHKVFHRLAHLIPSYLVFILIPVALQGLSVWIFLLQTIVKIYIVIIIVRAINGLLKAFHELYQTFEIAKYKPIKGYIQIFQIIVYAIAAILALSFLMGKSPVYFITGLGAVSAVLLLIFKDVLLGFVASIQLSANDMVRPGDWITMPKFGADGDVIEITLTAVRIRNFDMTIISLPTYSMISDGFQNWRGMKEAGGRRIKRAMLIDLQSIRFVDDELLERLKKFKYIESYIENRQEEINKYNEKINSDAPAQYYGRRQTNIGIFRAYIQAYLQNSPNINTDMMLMTRQLPPANQGLPLEIYAFTNTTDWVAYEGIISDIFDHLLAVIHEFDLKTFQDPSGVDFQRLISLVK
ncbi:MAG: mechanosensitive ion channel [Bacteroidales bacterium]|nr:mechanosensitive ion channel [Bacteroidales bacterium]